jgi:hypothetical protein
MLVDRIIGAFTFRSGVYAEVERDKAFTTTAWILVAVVAFINQIGAAASRNLVGWLLGAVVGTVAAVIGFAVAAFVISLVGRAAFNADVNFEEMVRTLGLAYVWQVVGVIGVVRVLSPTLAPGNVWQDVGVFGGVHVLSPSVECVTAPALLLAGLLWLVASFVATKEALDLEWLQTIITVIIGWLVFAAIVVGSGIVLGLLGLGAAGVGGLLG